MERIELRIPEWLKSHLKSKDNMSNYIRGLIVKDIAFQRSIKNVTCTGEIGQKDGHLTQKYERTK